MARTMLKDVPDAEAVSLQVFSFRDCRVFDVGIRCPAVDRNGQHRPPVQAFPPRSLTVGCVVFKMMRTGKPCNYRVIDLTWSL